MQIYNFSKANDLNHGRSRTRVRKKALKFSQTERNVKVVLVNRLLAMAHRK